MLGLPEGAPVYLDGASSGGSVALRVPGIVNVTVDGVIGGERSTRRLRGLGAGGACCLPAARP